MVRIYKQKQFNLYSNLQDGFIIHNINKPFQEGHTHINSYDTSLYLIKLATHKTVPNHLSVYLIDSLIRISTDDAYIRKLRSLKLRVLPTRRKK